MGWGGVGYVGREIKKEKQKKELNLHHKKETIIYGKLPQHRTGSKENIKSELI